MNFKKVWEGIRAGWTVTRLIVKIPHSKVVDEVLKVIDKEVGKKDDIFHSLCRQEDIISGVVKINSEALKIH